MPSNPEPSNAPKPPEGTQPKTPLQAFFGGAWMGKSDLSRVASVIAVSIGLGGLVIWFYGGRSAAAFLWGLACLTAGAIVGFLFGIPRVLQGSDGRPERGDRNRATGQRGSGEQSSNPSAAPEPAAGDRTLDPSSDYRQQVNTNLEQISDWLTKIIVGLGLVELRNIPGYVDSMAERLAQCFETPCGMAFAGALIVYFSVVGFFSGYLLTRLFLASAFSRADQAALQRLTEELQRVREKVKSTEETLRAQGRPQGITSPQPGQQPEVSPPPSPVDGGSAPLPPVS
jgi:hypothetical protein